MSKRASLIAHAVYVVLLNAAVISVNATLWFDSEIVDTSAAAVITTVFFVVAALGTVLLVVHMMAIHLSPSVDEVQQEEVPVEDHQFIEVSVSAIPVTVQPVESQNQFLVGFAAGSLFTAILSAVLRQRR